jgi:amino acid transporter
MAEKRVKLKKSMGAGSIWAVALGSIIGWGCFIQGGLWTQRAGGPLPLFLGFLVGGLLMIVVGYSYSYMIAKFPVAGGEFAYAYKGFGRTASYICGWMLSLGYLSIVALNATALPVLASYIFPGVFNKGYLYTIAGYDVYMGEVAIALFFIILFGIMNYMGAKSVGKLQLAMVLIMCAAVVISVVGTIVTGSFDTANLAPAYGAGGKTFGGGFISILALAPFLYVGFDCIPQSAEEYDFPPQKCKLLIISALIIGAVIYGLMALVTDCVIPWQDVLALTDASGAPVKWHTGAVLEMAMGKIGVIFVAIAVCMGIFTGMNGFFMTSSRLLFGMARAKMLPAAFAKIHPKHKTPSVCIIFVMIVCCICPFFGREVIGWVVDMCSVGTAFGYFFTCAGAYILLKKYGDENDTNRIHPVVALGGCVISVAILLLLIVPGSPAPQSFVALVAWIVLGVIFYFCSRKKFMVVTKREMDYLILGNVQVVRGVRKGQKQSDIVQGNIVNPK